MTYLKAKVRRQSHALSIKSGCAKYFTYTHACIRTQLNLLTAPGA